MSYLGNSELNIPNASDLYFARKDSHATETSLLFSLCDDSMQYFDRIKYFSVLHVIFKM